MFEFVKRLFVKEQDVKSKYAGVVFCTWEEEALAKLHEAVSFERKPFTIEQIRKKIEIRPPHDLRRWGHVTVMALKAGYIKKTGQYALAECSNMSPRNLYAKGW